MAITKDQNNVGETDTARSSRSVTQNIVVANNNKVTDGVTFETGIQSNVPNSENYVQATNNQV